MKQPHLHVEDICRYLQYIILLQLLILYNFMSIIYPSSFYGIWRIALNGIWLNTANIFLYFPRENSTKCHIHVTWVGCVKANNSTWSKVILSAASSSTDRAELSTRVINSMDRNIFFQTHRGTDKQNTRDFYGSLSLKV